MSKVVITGATGAIGFRLLEKLNKDYDVIYALGRNFDRFEKFEKKIVPVWCDLSVDIDNNVAHMLSECDTLIHLAANVSETKNIFEEFSNFNNININGTIRILKVLENLQRIVFLSTTTVYDPGMNRNKCHKCTEEDYKWPKGHYSISKLIIENLLRIYSEENRIGLCVLRVSSVFSPNRYLKHNKRAINVFSDAVTNGDLITLQGTGNHKRNYIFLDDVVNAIIWSCKNNISGVYNLCSTKHTTLNQIIHYISKILQKESKIKYSDFIEKPQCVSAVKITRMGFVQKFSIEKALQKILFDQ